MANTSVMYADPDSPLGCRSELGAYYLSKTTLEIVATRKSVEIARREPEVWSELTVVPKRGVADRATGYCLDFLASATSKDNMTVDRDENGVLKTVSSVADDQSKEIIKTLVQAIFTGIAGGPFDPTLVRAASAPSIKTEDTFKAEYDPTDGYQAGLINKRLKDFGLCLLLHPRSCLEIPTNYCDDPMAHTPRKKYVGGDRRGHQSRLPPERESNATRFVDYRNGLLYRPMRPVKFCLYQKDKFARDWLLAKERAVEIENTSPVFSIGVDRTFFAKRETELTFAAGVLQNVRIKKDSELLGFVSIPLQIANSIAALPANIIQVKIVDLDNRKEIQAMETDLLNKQLALENALQDYELQMSKSQ